MDIIMKNKLYAIVIVVLILVNFLSIGSIWYLNFRQNEIQQNPREENREKKQERREPKDPKTDDNNIIEFLVKELKFKEDQKKLLELKYQDYKRENLSIKDEIRDFHNEINDKVPLDISNNDIDLQFEKIGKKKGDLDKLTFIFFKSVRNICDKEQKNIFDEMIREIYRAISKGPDNKRK